MKSSAAIVTVQELHRCQSEGGAPVVIDVRTPGEFAGGHVPGAKNVPLGSQELEVFGRSAEGRSGKVFVICQSGGRSARCCEQLTTAGVSAAVSVEGGTGAWAAAGFPLARESARGGVISLERQVRIAAGALVLCGCGLGHFVHVGFFGLAAFVGAGLVFAGVTDFCGMGLLMARMPWNRR